MKNAAESGAMTERFPFEVEQLPAEVYASMDRNEISELIIEKLTHDGINPETVVFSGFDAEDLIRRGGFGERDSTYAVGVDSMADDEADHSPMKYIESDMPDRPAIGVFWLEKLVGSDAKDPREYLTDISAEMLKRDPKLIYWATKDGLSLDGAAAKLFLL